MVGTLQLPGASPFSNVRDAHSSHTAVETQQGSDRPPAHDVMQHVVPHVQQMLTRVEAGPAVAAARPGSTGVPVRLVLECGPSDALMPPSAASGSTGNNPGSLGGMDLTAALPGMSAVTLQSNADSVLKVTLGNNVQLTASAHSARSATHVQLGDLSGDTGLTGATSVTSARFAAFLVSTSDAQQNGKAMRSHASGTGAHSMLTSSSHSHAGHGTGSNTSGAKLASPVGVAFHVVAKVPVAAEVLQGSKGSVGAVQAVPVLKDVPAQTVTETGTAGAPAARKRAGLAALFCCVAPSHAD